MGGLCGSKTKSKDKNSNNKTNSYNKNKSQEQNQERLNNLNIINHRDNLQNPIVNSNLIREVISPQSQNQNNLVVLSHGPSKTLFNFNFFKYHKFHKEK
jgi:hypothetical protein